jgi:hypothetical protein
MQARRRLWITVWMGLMGLLVGCALRPADSPSSLEAKLGDIPGLDQAGPFATYRLDLFLEADRQRLTGRQQVAIPNRTGVELSEIVFRLYPNLPQYGGRLGIGPVWVDGERGTSSLRTEDTSLVIPLSPSLPPDESVTISMTFDVEIPQRDGGYVLFGYSQGMWSLPDAYPLLAVHDRMGWHEDLAPAHGDAVFAEAALYEVTLTVPPTLTVALAGTVMTDTLDAEGRRIYRVIGGPFREFAWLASADYAVSETRAQGATVRSYYLMGDESAGQAALNTAAAALRAYGDAFGPYPFPVMTVVEAPMEYYGMEYPGLNLIGLALYRDHRAELEDRIAHEIAHQWWYSQVGNDQINTPWLDEGLAEYSTATYYRQVYGEARANTLVNQRWLVPYQVAVEEGRDAIVNQPSLAFGEEYEVVVYGKAALFFDALRQNLGDETYLAVLRQYVDRFRWRIATPDDFLLVAEEVSGQDLDGLYSRWILTKK